MHKKKCTIEIAHRTLLLSFAHINAQNNYAIRPSTSYIALSQNQATDLMPETARSGYFQ
ncbi:MAG: hypothetical protein JWQ38_374 [Flavipsychrobacter sp.]|nr:hypothetical protein [Flavipsychrobacter sp.]